MRELTPKDQAIVAAMIKARELGVKMLASDCEAILDVAKSIEFMPCGHHKSLLLYSAETELPLYCEYCDAISIKNDAERMEALLRQQLGDMEKLYNETMLERDVALRDADILRQQFDIAVKAINETIEDNLHLSDGDNCTLIKLKQALSTIKKGGE